jgi:hypothetical protein
MSWQRRVCELPIVESLTELEVGTKFVWDERDVLKCPNCGRAGVAYKKAIIHARDYEGNLMDFCMDDDFKPEAPTMITYDVNGKVLNEFWPTNQKTGERS